MFQQPPNVSQTYQQVLDFWGGCRVSRLNEDRRHFVLSEDVGMNMC